MTTHREAVLHKQEPLSVKKKRSQKEMNMPSNNKSHSTENETKYESWIYNTRFIFIKLITPSGKNIATYELHV